MPSLILVGDVNLMNVEDAGAPFARVGETLRSADLVFANLECLLYEPPDGHTVLVAAVMGALSAVADE